MELDSNGTDVLTEAVTVTFGDFGQTLPSSSFVRNDDDAGFVFEGEPPVIKEVEIDDDGTLEVEAEDLNLSLLDLSAPVRFTPQIGDDAGTVEIQLDGEGEFVREGDDDGSSDDDD